MSLEERLKARIRLEGPITVADYMTACLHDPRDGYYAVRPRIGSEGDFVTAPLISQMFGELLGLWAVETWRRLGAPERFRLVEVGPGDGTLMDDALRAARVDPAFVQAAELVLVEPSRPLRQAQARRLSGADVEPRWVSDLSGLETDLPVILIANEVLDCLPARQFVRTEDGWAERRVGLDQNDALAFGLAPSSHPPINVKAAPGQVVEVSAAQAGFGRALGELVGGATGAALLIDYGRARPEPGDTLQALIRHAKVSPLERPGHADLTVWADFPTVLAAALPAGADVTGVVPQGAFLRALGIEARAAALARANPPSTAVLARQGARLVDADQMGELFKAAAVFAPRSLAVPGFEGLA
jgi:SAM-dependent MidA family methyltransferase